MSRLRNLHAVFYKDAESNPSKQLLELVKENKENVLDKIRDLKKKGADPNTKEDDKDKKNKQRSPIHYAAKQGNVEVLKFLLNWNKDNIQDGEVSLEFEGSLALDVDLRDNKGRSALHYAAKTCCTSSKSHCYVECLTVLMDVASLNLPDGEGYTPVTYAVLRRQKDRLLAMLNHERGESLNLDISPADGEVTARTAIKKFYPDISENLPMSIVHLHKNANILQAMTQNKPDDFLKLLSTNQPNPHYDDPYHATCIEIACSMENGLEFVRTLLSIGVSPNTRNSIYNKPLLHRVVGEGKVDILELLLDHPDTDVQAVDNYGRNALHYAVRLQCEGPSAVTRIHTCVNKLLHCHLRGDKSKPKFDIEKADNDGNTVLHLAGRYAHEEIVLTLLRNEASLLAKNNDGEYALTAIDTDTLRTFLDEKVDSTNNSPEDSNFYLEFSYGFLRGNRSDDSITILKLLSERPHLRELLKHPILRSFLDMRWQKVRRFFWLNIFLYTLFVIFLTVRLLITDYNGLNQVIITNAELDFSTITRIILLCLLVILILREVIQLLLNPNKYLKNPENYLECALLACSLVVLYTDSATEEVKRHLSPIVILMAWTELVLITGGLPILSVQLEMSKKVALTFLQYIPWYTLVIAAFGLSFYTLFRDVQNSDENLFLHPVTGIFKTVIMMTGEYDMSSPLFDAIPITSHLVFLLFVILVAIGMLNLLSGLAVGDTNNIRKQADVLSLVHRVKLVAFIEDSLRFFFDRFDSMSKFPSQMWVFPNSKRAAYTDVGSCYTVEKIIIHDAMEIVANKKRMSRMKNRKKALRSGREIVVGSTTDERVVRMLESYERRFESMEEMLRQLLLLSGGRIPRVRVKFES